MRGPYYRRPLMQTARHFNIGPELAFCPNCDLVFARGKSTCQDAIVDHCPQCNRVGVPTFVTYKEAIPEKTRNQIKNITEKLAAEKKAKEELKNG